MKPAPTPPACRIPAGLAALFTALALQAQPFVPTRPVELVVHGAPGGGSDVFAHALADMVVAEKLVAQPLRVVNRTAGAGVQAMEYLAARRGDDHTIAVFTNAWLATPLTRRQSAHTVKDFTPIARRVLEPTIAVVRADSPYRTMADFVAAAKKDPGGLKQAGGSATAIESLTGLLIRSATGARWTFTSVPAVKDRMAGLVEGRVDIVIPQPQDANEHIAAGKVRPIAALTEKRLAVFPGRSPSRASACRSSRMSVASSVLRACPARRRSTGRTSSRGSRRRRAGRSTCRRTRCRTSSSWAVRHPVLRRADRRDAPHAARGRRRAGPRGA